MAPDAGLPHAALPLITASLPGIGGTLKQTPEDFVVEEVPLYEATGDGDHLYINLTRRGWNTRDVAMALAQSLGLRVEAVGYAGMKDRQARSTQTFSLLGATEADVDRVSAELPFEINWMRRHRNKLRVGHLLGNRFAVLVREPAADAAARVLPIVQELQRRGVPNYFGPQRFGREGDNAQRGREVLLGQGPRQRWLRKLVVSAYQSDLFNRYLARRLSLGAFDRLLDGDVAKKQATGGLFVVEQAEVEQARYDAHEISYTGPLFGAKMKAAGGPSAALEADILAAAALPESAFKRAGVDGGRRPGRLLLETIDVEPVEDGLWLGFMLPKGGYATVLLREIMKTDVTLEGESDDA